MSEELLELAIDYVVSTQYPPGLDKAKKRAIRRHNPMGDIIFQGGAIYFTV